jgi:hypothetical protein
MTPKEMPISHRALTVALASERTGRRIDIE